MITITITDESGNPLPYAYVYTRIGNSDEDILNLRADGSGRVRIAAKEGIYQYAAYVEEYSTVTGIGLSLKIKVLLKVKVWKFSGADKSTPASTSSSSSILWTLSSPVITSPFSRPRTGGISA